MLTTPLQSSSLFLEVERGPCERDSRRILETMYRVYLGREADRGPWKGVREDPENEVERTLERR